MQNNKKTLNFLVNLLIQKIYLKFMTKPVAIIGGGITGLYLANLLHRNRIPFVLFEKDSHWGGRVQTDKKGMFLMDRGFQVLQSGYPALQGELDFKALDLKFFPSGAMCKKGDEFIEFPNPFQNIFPFFSLVFSGFIGLKDLVAFVRLYFDLSLFRFDYQKMSATSASDYLIQLGFSDKLKNVFFFPFFGGVFLDKSLRQPKELFLFFMQEFLKGTICIPAKGMGEIAQQLAYSLPKESLFLNAQVEISTKNELIVDNKKIEVAGIVVATDQSSAFKLLQISPDPSVFGACKNLYFTIEKGKFDSGILYLVNQNILHFSVISQVSPDYSDSLHDLISITCLNLDLEEKVIIQEFESLFPSIKILKKVGEYILPEALPGIDSKEKLKNTAREKGLILAGDYLLYPSLNACFESGKQAFESCKKILNFTS